MTKKELEELVKKQSEQISELISLVQELKNNRNQIVIKSEQPAPNQIGTPWTPATKTLPDYYYYYSEPIVFSSNIQ